MNNLTPAGRERVCQFCARPWFGSVAYCPYCGQKRSLAALDQPRQESAHEGPPAATQEESLRMPAVEPGFHETEPTRKEPSGPLPESAPIAGAQAPLQADTP